MSAIKKIKNIKLSNGEVVFLILCPPLKLIISMYVNVNMSSILIRLMLMIVELTKIKKYRPSKYKAK